MTDGPLMAVRPMPTVLKKGSHRSPEDGMCSTEAVAWIAGEEHSDRPDCCCPVLAAFVRSWNDGMRSDAERDRLLKWVPRLVGTRADADTERRRAEMALDWLVHECAPAWLDLAGLAEHAAGLRAMSGIDQPKLDAASAAAGAAARAAAENAAENAVWAAAENAVRAAASVAARAAAGAAVRAAAENAVWAAAGAAARAAAENAVWAAASAAASAAARDAAREPTAALLQDSAEVLLSRMIKTS